MKYTVILTPDAEDGGYTAECPVLPGCISEGDTVEEALNNIQEAIAGCLESLPGLLSVPMSKPIKRGTL